MTYTFHLKDGIKFHSGKALTSEDVKWTWERWRTESGTCYSYYLDFVDTIETPDEKTVVVNMSKPDNNFLVNISGLLGPILGGMVYGFWGMGTICLISAACFLASAVMECFLRIPFVPQKSKGGAGAVLSDLREAGSFLSRSGCEEEDVCEKYTACTHIVTEIRILADAS